MKFVKILSVFWTLTSIAIAAFGVFQSYDGNPEGGIAPAILLYVLTAPIGIIVQISLLSLLKVLLGFPLNIGLTGDILFYALMIVCGYFQWFIVLPALIMKFKKWKARG